MIFGFARNTVAAHRHDSECWKPDTRVRTAGCHLREAYKCYFCTPLGLKRVVTHGGTW